MAESHVQHLDASKVESDRKLMQQLLAPAGITLNGPNPYDLQVNDERLYHRVIQQGSLGLGESYMDGWFDVEAIDTFIEKMLLAHVDRYRAHDTRILIKALLARFLNMQSRNRAFEVGEKHYDIGNDLFEKMLDPTMSYSCGYWNEATTLADAQVAKLDLVCRKLQLKPGMRMLDIGCGWGGLSAHAAKNYGVEVVGVTISREQQAYAKQRYADLPIDFLLQDYREITGRYDRVASIGMFEHVGHKNYRNFMKVAHRSLKPGGLMVLHTIASHYTTTSCDPWINKYIFPNGLIPSIRQIDKAMHGLFVLEDLHNFGPDYDTTLTAWHENFVNSWDSLKDKYDERFYRMWRYYLKASCGVFRSRDEQLMQFVLSKNRSDVYRAPR